MFYYIRGLVFSKPPLTLLFMFAALCWFFSGAYTSVSIVMYGGALKLFAALFLFRLIILINCAVLSKNKITCLFCFPLIFLSSCLNGMFFKNTVMLADAFFKKLLILPGVICCAVNCAYFCLVMIMSFYSRKTVLYMTSFKELLLRRVFFDRESAGQWFLLYFIFLPVLFIAAVIYLLCAA